MSDLSDGEILIGVDGGASEVKAHQVLVLSPSLALGAASASCCYDAAPGFDPVPLAEQLVALERRRVRPTRMEIAQGDLWVDAAASTIAAVAAEAADPADANRPRVRVGVCFPGLKTADGRGLAVVRNGPRVPDFLDRLEGRLERAGLVLVRPIPPLLSDGDACGIGENVHVQGMLRAVSSAYYIGGGTGLAEALKISGEIVSFDALRGWMPKAWAMESALGGSFEQRISMGGINVAYAARSGRPVPVQHDEFPEQRAARGDVHAIAVMDVAARALAELVFARMRALAKGRRAIPSSTAVASRAADAVGSRAADAAVARAAEAAGGERASQAWPSTFLDRVVFGQRLAHLFADESLREVFRDVVEVALAEHILHADDPALAEHYLAQSHVRSGLLCASSLRAAPALGAAAVALELGASAPRPRQRESRSAREARG
jgi:hypothetical protein